MMQIVLVGLGAGAASALAVRVGRIRFAAVGPAVLSGAAADPDRRASAGATGPRWSQPSPPRSGLRPLSAAVFPVRIPDRCRSCRPGGSAISPCSRARPMTAREQSRRMVSGRPAGAVVRRHRRRHGDCRHPEFRARRRAIPRRAAPRLRTGAAGSGPRARGLRTRCDKRQRQASDRSAGHHHAAGRRRARDRHLLGQSLSRRPRREGFRPPEAAMAGSAGDPRFRSRPISASRRRLLCPSCPGMVGTIGGIVVGGADHGLRDRWALRFCIRSRAMSAAAPSSSPAPISRLWSSAGRSWRMTLLGLADAIFDFRKRVGAGTPPAPTS